MPDQLPVHVNRRELHSLEVPATFEATDSFVIEVENHGEAGRIHVHLDEGLADAASVEATNYYVQANASIEIPVSVHDAGPIEGKVKLVSGYGAVTRWVDVEITEQEDIGEVVVDEDLGKPQPRPENHGGAPGDAGMLEDRPSLPVVALGTVAVLAAVAAAMYFRNAVVAGGAAVVVLTVLAAGYLLLR